MPTFFVMDCEKGSETENNQQGLLEKNNEESEIDKMKSDFLVLKQKIICTDTLIKKVQEKHKYCELLEKKCTEMKKILDASMKECHVHTSEYQELLLKFGPLKQEMELLETKSQHQSDEIEKLKNNIRCFEVVQNQMKEASKKQQADLDISRKDNKLLQSKLNKLKLMNKNSEKKQAADEEKKKKSMNRNTHKKLSSKGIVEEEEVSFREMAHNIETQFAGGEIVNEQDSKDSTLKPCKGIRRKKIRNSSKFGSKKPKPVKSGRKRKAKRVPFQNVYFPLGGKDESGVNSRKSVENNSSEVLERTSSAGNGEGFKENKRLALLYEDLLISSDDEVQEIKCIKRNPPSSYVLSRCADETQLNTAPVEKINVPQDEILIKDATDNKIYGSFSETLNSENILNKNEESPEVWEKICCASMNVVIDVDNSTDSQTIEYQWKSNHVETNNNQLESTGDIDLTQTSLEDLSEMENDETGCTRNRNTAAKNLSSGRSNGFAPKSGGIENKRTSCRNKRKFDSTNEVEEVEIVKCSKQKRKRKIKSDYLHSVRNVSGPNFKSVKNFKKFSIDDALSIIGVERPVSPLGSKSASKKVGDFKKQVRLNTGEHFHSNGQPEYLIRRQRIVSKSCLFHSCKEIDLNCLDGSTTLSPEIIRNLYHKLLKLVKFNYQPISPFLFEMRHLKINGMVFIKIVMKTIRKYSFDVKRFWFKNESDDSKPCLPLSLMRLVEILISCGTTLDQSKETLELFIKASFDLIIHHQWRGQISKFNECFISSLCCCIVGILRSQGNMERVRMLLYEVIRNSCESSRVCSVIMTICAVWPQCLTSITDENNLCAIQEVLKHYVTNSIHQDNQVRDFVKQICGWEIVDQNPNDLASKLFEHAGIFFNQESIAQDAASRVSWDIQTALMLLCCKEGWDWTSNSMISTFIWSFLGAWASGSENFSDYFVQLVIDLLGLCSGQYLKEIDQDNYNNIFDNLKSLVSQSSVSLKIRESALRSIFRMLDYSSTPCDVVVSFIKQHKILFDDETLALLEPFSLNA